MPSIETSNPIDTLRNSASKACSLLKSMANEDRLLILCLLSQGERNVSEIETETKIQQPTLSQQLTKLRDDGLVSTRRDGKYIYYVLSSIEVIQVMQTLSRLYCKTSDVPLKNSNELKPEW